MGTPCRPFHGERSPRPVSRFLRADDANFLSATLPLALAVLGLAGIATGLILNLPLLTLAGAGLVVVGGATHMIAAAMDRADRRAARARREKSAARTPASPAAPLPPRGPLADAAVAALTQPGERGGIWPPLSSQAPKPSQAPARPVAKAATRPVTMWEPREKIGTQAFSVPAPAMEEELVEFTPVAQGDVLLAAERPMAPQEPRIQVAVLDEPAPAERDFRVWPGAKDLGTWGHFTGERAHEEERDTAERRAVMLERRARLAARLPTVGAILAEGAHADRPPKGDATRGKCSRCARFIWAPAERPITLKCPGCGHKARLY